VRYLFEAKLYTVQFPNASSVHSLVHCHKQTSLSQTTCKHTICHLGEEYVFCFGAFIMNQADQGNGIEGGFGLLHSL